MNITVRRIGGEYKEMYVDEIKTGTMDEKEAIGQAQVLIYAASELLRGCERAGIDELSSICLSVDELIGEIR